MKQNSFTLSEVLITLVIIGVIAALTIPALVGKVEEHENKQKYLKMYSVLSNAYRMILADNGGTLLDAIDYSYSSTTNNAVRDLFAEKLKYIKKCDAYESDCMPKDRYGNDVVNTKLDQTTPDSNLSFSDSEYESKIVLQDGSYISFATINPTCDPTDKFYECVRVAVDTNGAAPPNKRGRDVAWLELSNTRLFAYQEGYFATGGNNIAWHQSFCTETDGAACGVLWLMNIR